MPYGWNKWRPSRSTFHIYMIMKLSPALILIGSSAGSTTNDVAAREINEECDPQWKPVRVPRTQIPISTVRFRQSEPNRLVVWETLIKQAKDVQRIVNTNRSIASLLATMNQNASQIVQEKPWLVWINAHAILVITFSLPCKLGGHFWVQMNVHIRISNNAIRSLGPSNSDRRSKYDRLNLEKN